MCDNDAHRQLVVWTLRTPSVRACCQCRTCPKRPKHLLYCACCKYAGYCNAVCQKKHWPKHKVVCSGKDAVHFRWCRKAEKFIYANIKFYRPALNDCPAQSCVKLELPGDVNWRKTPSQRHAGTVDRDTLTGAHGGENGALPKSLENFMAVRNMATHYVYLLCIPTTYAYLLTI